MEHGTRYAWYKKGCRCDECREGRRAADYARRQRRFERAKADPSIIPNHGVQGYTDYGCRCEVCTVANRVENRNRQGMQPAKTWTPEQITLAMSIYTKQGPRPAAEAVDASTTTILRWAKQRGITYQRPLRHGTRNAYSRRGCRCETCVDGNRAQVAKDKAKLQAKKDQAPHGTATAYRNWACRCEPCKKAGAVDNAKFRAKRLARQSA